MGRLRALGTSLRRACRLIGLSTATWRYQRRPDPTNVHLRDRLQAHAAERPRFGYRRLHTLVDWTDGCIAVTDSQIEEISRVVADGTPIRIEP